jgi:glycosyltransferase involved in cell wall biosynthesis
MMRTFAGFNKVNFVNNSLVGAKDYENWLNLKPGTIKVIYNGYNIKDFNNIPLQIYNSKPALVGGVMRFNSEKNVKLWVESAACLISRGANVRFILIGDGIERPAIEKLIANLGLSDKFFLMKPIREVYTVMSEFNVLLLTSRHEGLPNVLIEAQLLGVPVVSTNAGGASETFIDKVSGYLVEVNDPERIADCLFEIITNKDLAKRFSRYAKRHSSHRFSISSTIEQYANIYGSLNES